jgi:glutathione peroxidase
MTARLNIFVAAIVFIILTVNAAKALDLGVADKTTSHTSESPSNKGTSKKESIMSIYTFKAKALNGDEISFDKYKGDVLLIVNTASECGFTPQYKGLEELYTKYEGRGLKVLGFPCNQFGGQEPGSGEDIAKFCHQNYGVTFQMFDKIDVNGKGTNPLYVYLKSQAPGLLSTEGIKWNFTKFLVDRKGNVVKRFGPDVKPQDIADDIEKQL